MSLERVSDDRKSTLKKLSKTKREPLKGVTLGGNTLDTLGVTPLNQNDLKAIYVNTLSPRSRAMRFLLGLKV